MSGRFSQARIIAVEMLRGPDHIATRTVTGTVTGRPCPATSAATCSAYKPWSRSTTGPRLPVPMVRPSTVRTGTSPAKVPVTNASCAE